MGEEVSFEGEGLDQSIRKRKEASVKEKRLSSAAKEQLEASGCSLTVLPGPKKWVKPSVAKNLARAEEYFAKKKAVAAAAEHASA